MFGLLHSAQAASSASLLQHIAPAVSCALSSQRTLAQAARSRTRKGAATTEGDDHHQQSSSSSAGKTAASASLHVTEAMSASSAVGSRLGKTPDPAKKSMLNDTMKRVNKQLG